MISAGVPDAIMLATVLARSGAKIEQVVRLAHGVFVVLDDQHGVAKIAQIDQRRNQPLIVALMQADDGSSST